MPEYPRTRTRGTRACGTRVPMTGTGMRQVGYDFEKKKPSTRARRIRLPAVPVPALPAARRGCTRSVPAVPASKSLPVDTMDVITMTLHPV
jgi:hypothetical protein